MKIIYFAAILLLLNACTPGKSASEYFLSAQKSYQSDEYKTAIIELKNALTEDPQFVEAKSLLARSYFQLGEYPAAAVTYEKLLITKSVNAEDLAYALRSYLFLGDIQKAKSLVSNHQNLERLDLIELEATLAINLLFNGEQESLNLLQRVLSYNLQDNLYTKLSKAVLASRDGQIVEAIQLIKGLNEQDNVFNDALLLQARLEVMNEDNQKALELYEAFLSKHPWFHLTRLEFASLLMADKQYSKGKEQIDKLLTIYPQHPVTNELNAEYYLNSNDFEQALKYANAALVNQPDRTKSIFIAGVSSFRQEQYETSYQHLTKIENLLKNNNAVKQMLVSLRFRLGYLDAVVEQLEAKETVNDQDFDLLVSTSLALLNDGQKNQAKKFIEQLAGLNVNNPDDLGKVGALKLAVQDQGGVKDLKQALELDEKNLQAKLILLQNYLRNNRADEAMIIANEWIVSEPENEYGYLAKGLIFNYKKQRQESIKAFNTALTIKPDSIGALYNLAKYDIENKAYEDAFIKLKNILTQNQQHVGSLKDLLVLIPHIDNPSRVSAFLESQRSEVENQITMIIALARAQELEGNPDEGIATLDGIFQEAQDNVLYLQNLGQMNFRAKHYDKAEKIFTNLIKISPKHYFAHRDLLSSLEVQKKLQQALAHVKKAQGIYPDDTSFVYYEAHLYILENNYEQAKLLVEGVAKETVHPKLYYTLHTKLLVNEGNFAQALKYSDQLILIEPNYANLITNIKLLTKNNQKASAIKKLEALENKYTKTSESQFLLAELLINDDPNRSVSIYQELAEKHTGNVILFNNLAWAALNANKLTLSLENAKKAVDLAPDNYQVIDTLGVAYLKNKQYALAEETLKKAKELEPKNVDVTLHYAEALIYLKKYDQCRSLLNTLQPSEDKKKIEVLLENQKA